MTSGLASATPPVRPCRLYLRTLGSAELVRLTAEGESEALLDPSKLLAMVAFLALSPGRTATRDGLIDLLWSDLEPDAARHALRQHLWQLKQRVGADLVVDGREQLTLRSAIASDRNDFLAAAEASDLERAVGLYRGEFFPGFAAAGSVEFDRWVDGERARMGSTFVRCAELLAKQRLDGGRSREAVALCRRIRDEDPIRQHGWRLLLEALVASRDLLSAAVEAEAFERLLVEEELELEPATRSLFATVRHAVSARRDDDARPPLRIELVGREREFASLIRAWDRARTGRLTVVHITAPAGLGKTRLLTELSSRLGSMRARSLSVRANVGASGIAYWLAGEIAEKLAPLPGARGVPPDAMRVLVGLNPALSSIFGSTPLSAPDADGVRHRVVALRELIAAVAEEKPLALLIDDLHWADATSRAVLSGVVGALDEDTPVLFCIAERPEMGSLPPTTETMRLGPLTPAAVSSLVAGIASLPETGWSRVLVSDLMHGTGGIPLYIVETLQLSLEQGLLRIDDGTWQCDQPEALHTLLLAGGVLDQRLKQLGQDELRILDTLAVAGAPVGERLLSRTWPDATWIEGALEGLYQKGLVSRAGATFAVAHDEIGALVRKTSAGGALREVHLALGRALASDAGNDMHRARMAAVQLRAADAQQDLRALFVRFVREARRLGDRRTSLGLAADFLGSAPSAAETIALTASLPLAVRLGLVTPARVAATISAVVLIPLGIAGIVIARSGASRPVPDAILAVAVQGRRGLAIHDLALDTTAWRADSVLRVSARGRPRGFYAGSGFRDLAARPAHPGMWAAAQAFPDSGAWDLVLLTPTEERPKRLTSTIGDDITAAWSPDGKQLVFVTGRWNELQHYDLAVLDLETMQVRALTSGDETDGSPQWSPDGTRIAFWRMHWDGRPEEICVMGVDGSGRRCTTWGMDQAEDSQHNLRLVGWLDESTLLVGDRSGSYRRVGALTLAAQDTFSLPGETLLSPNGRWLACHCAAGEATAWAVYRMGRTTEGRSIAIDDIAPDQRGVMVSWARPGNPPFIDRVDIQRSFGSPRIGVPHQLRAQVRDIAGGYVKAHTLTFWSSDSTVATIDSLGVVFPRRPGSTTITASVGGWRRDSVRLEFVHNRIDTLLVEDWNRGILPVWRPFGDPLPAIASLADGSPAFQNRGDGRFLSGAHSARSYDSKGGLALDFALSTPISLPQWQQQHVTLVAGVDSMALSAWDHRTADPQSVGLFPPNDSCEFGFASGREGPARARGDSMSAGGTRRVTLPAPVWMRSGQVYRVRLQLFPDGRCGVAVNGVPISMNPPVRSAWPVHIFLTGNSVRTKILVGPLTLMRGVPTDIDWTERTASTASIPSRPWR